MAGLKITSFFAILLSLVHAQTSIPSSVNSIITDLTPSAPSGPYTSYATTITTSTTATPSSSSITSYSPTNGTSSNTPSSSTATTSSSVLLLVGSSPSTIISSSVTSTSSSPSATNTQPCNGYVEFCNRKYSNITEVCSHNSAFIRNNSAFANQNISLAGQLNDGIRMIQGETHLVNNTIYNCHTNCSFFNVGPYQDELTTIRQWIEEDPYDVVTILIANSDFVDVGNYTAPFVNSGLLQYLYEPPKIPMGIDDWPTLGQMILSTKRVVVFMDYMANQTAVPYILDQYSQMWETLFSPTNESFPCTIDRPPGISVEQQDGRMYLANHNLNLALDILGNEILIPNIAQLEEVNAVNGTAGLGTMAERCRADHGRAPNFLVVDYYGVGDGSVFEAAALMNNVTYNRKCCGLNTEVTSTASKRSNLAGLSLFIALLVSALTLG